MGQEQRVLFVDMPFRDVNGPALALSTLAAILRREHMSVDVKYLNIDFAKAIDVSVYRFFSSLGGSAYRGEIFFTPSYYGFPLQRFASNKLPSYFEGCWKRHGSGVPLDGIVDEPEFLARCNKICVSDVPTFLEQATTNVDWDRYDIVGFSLMFDQTLSSLCLAEWIKEHYPEKWVIFGGSSCDGAMGPELLRGFPCVDVVAVGEADKTIVPLIFALRGAGDLAGIPGITYRDAGEIAQTDRGPLLNDLDWLPIPDHSDFFEQVSGLDIEPLIHFETSRGCWWGMKHLCSFCGLNANDLSFRRKSPERVLAEINTLVRQYPSRWLLAADNILDMSYFKTVLPMLKKRNAMVQPSERAYFFYETKSNLKKEQLELARQAGIMAVQPGIESFNDHILSLMQKGTTGIQQVQFVKWATEIGISLRYGILFGTAGETAEDYEEMRCLVPFISHLIPPKYVVPISIDRFSPYFTNPKSYGLTNVRPHPLYGAIFPDENLCLDKLAYKFVADHSDDYNESLNEAKTACARALIDWRDSFRPDTLVYEVTPSEVRILDRRGPTAVLAKLRGTQHEIFLSCDEQRRWDQVVRQFDRLDGDRVSAFLDRLHVHGWLYRDREGRCITTPVRRDLSRWLRGRTVAPSEMEELQPASFF